VTKAGVGTGTVTSSPAGINCGSTCVATFANGTTVTLSARTTGRNRFTGWTGDCVGIGSCVLTMSVDHAVTATFGRKGAAPTSACLVPRVVGLSLAKARANVRRANCSVGSIRRKASTRAKKGRVLAQAVKAGRTLRRGARVNLTVGKG
jgi:PASTA domain-containing protein